MLTQTLQGALQQAIRNATGKTTQDFNGDLHNLCDLYGIPAAPISGRIIPVAKLFDASINSSSAALNYLLNNSSTVVGPIALFANGEQGAWYDPSDLTTLFQDSAGTTPVTAVEQPVGLMLDKSKGLVLGPEIITNGDFSGGSTGWSLGTGWLVAGGVAIATSSPSGSNLNQIQTVYVSGRLYKVTFTVVSCSAGGFAARFEGSIGTTRNTPGTYTEYFFSSGLTQNSGVRTIGTTTGSVDNISVRELPGNHAYQSTSTSRPTLRARYNLLTYSEQFDNAAWTPIGVTRAADQTTAPDGTTTADRITSSSASNVVLFTTNAYTALAGNLTISLYIKAGTADYAVLSIWQGSGTLGVNLWVNVQTGSAGSNSATAGYTFVSGSSTPVGNGWYRVVVTGTVPAGAVYSSLRLVDSDNAFVYTNTSGKTLFIWGAQLIVTNSLLSNAYQRIAAATDYDTAGFLPYLSFDGTDDSLLTNSVNPGAVDKAQVFAGVRKLSDAANQMFAELSANGDSNNGTFYLSQSPIAPADAQFSSRGTSNAFARLASGFAAPITGVLTGIGDISGDVATLRINGSQVATSSTDQGTGNYGNYPLYIGRRNNATLPFNGNLYSLIVRFGSNLSASQISATEAWVNQKTGAF